MEKEGGSSSSDSLTDLSSLSSEAEDGVPSHRRFSSTSFLKSCAPSSANPEYQPQPTVSRSNKKTDSMDEERNELPQPDDISVEDTSSLDFRKRIVIPTIEVSEESPVPPTAATDQAQNSQSNQSSESNELNGSVTTSVAGSIAYAGMHVRGSGSGPGRIYTEEEVKVLRGQMADMQADIEQLLQYTQILNEENNALKKILKDAVIVYDQSSMQQLSDTLLFSTHEQPELRSVPRPPSITARSEPLKRRNPQNVVQSSMTEVPSSSTSSVHTTIPTVLSPLQERSTEMSTSVSHRALEVQSIASRHQLTSFKTEPLDPQKSSLTAARRVESGVSSTMFAAQSIKKLYDLTFEGGKKVKERPSELEERREDPSMKEAKAKAKVHSERRDGPSTAESGTFSSLHKLSTRRGGLRQRSSKLDDSPDLPRSNPPARRTTLSGSKVEKPNFYLRDILPVLQERNKLKEKVHLLECEVDSLKSECGMLRVAKSTWLSRHSWDGMLVDVPEEIQTLSESPGVVRTRATTIRLEPTVCDKEPYFTDAVATKYVPCGLHKVYSLEVTRSDGQRFEIYRRYGEFFTFHHTLVQLFPAEAGTYNSKQRVLPILPSIEDVLINSHLESINKYCRTLLTKMNRSVARSVFVTNFFNPSPKDKELPRLQKPYTRSEFDISDVFQMSLSAAGPSEEEYILLADYNTDAVGELSLSAGDVVQLINRETTGWWLVSTKVKDGESEKVGRIPGDFLKRYDSTDDLHHQSGENAATQISPEEILMSVTDPSMLYVAVEGYQAKDSRQINFDEGSQLIVLELCEDGWWLAWCEGKEGWVPASFLSPSTNVDDISLKWTDTPTGKTTGLQYIAMAAFERQNEADVTFPECAIIDVFNRSLTGWWNVRYEGSIGLAPATLLALTDYDFNAPDAGIFKEEKGPFSVDISHSISGYIEPPPRSQKYLALLQRGSLS